MADRQAEAGSAAAKALELLGRRAHFRAELEAKLAARGFPAAAVEEAMGRLAERGYLDDRAAARLWVEAAQRKGYGPRRLRAELVRRGVEAEIAAEAVAAVIGAGERERALAVAGRFRGSDPAALARHLDRKGFSKPIILAIVGKFPRQDAEE